MATRTLDLSPWSSGALVGLVQAVVGFPLDTYKVRAQVASTAKGGWLCGVCFPMAAAVVEMSVVFGISEKVHSHFKDYNIHDALKWSLAGGLSGLGSVIPNHFFDTFKIRSQLGEPCLSTPISPLWSGIFADHTHPRVYWYRGLQWTVYREVPAFSVYFGTYHWLRDCKEIHPFMAGGMAGWTSWLFTYPMDVVKTRVQAGFTYEKGWLVDPNIWRGFGIASARALLVNGVGFWTYDFLRNL